LSINIETLPNAKVGPIIRLVDELTILGGESDRLGIAYAMGIEEGTANTPIRAALLLGLIVALENSLVLTDIGREFSRADDKKRREIFGQQIRQLEPFATISRALAERPLSEEEIMNYVKARIPQARNWGLSTVKEMFRTIRGWCEFGEILHLNKELNKYESI